MLFRSALAGDDVVDASALAASAIALTVTGGDNDDVLIGGAGNDILSGNAGDDVLIGGPGIDVLDGAPGSDVVLDIAAANRVSSASVVGTKWLRKHATTVRGKTVLKIDGEKRKLPRAKLAKLKQGVSKF